MVTMSRRKEGTRFAAIHRWDLGEISWMVHGVYYILLCLFRFFCSYKTIKRWLYIIENPQTDRKVCGHCGHVDLSIYDFTIVRTFRSFCWSLAYINEHVQHFGTTYDPWPSPQVPLSPAYDHWCAPPRRRFWRTNWIGNFLIAQFTPVLLNLGF